MRVAGSPFTATALIGGTASNTVTWYTGEMGTDLGARHRRSRRSTMRSRSPTARAPTNRRIRSTIENIAVYAAMTFSPSDPNAQDRFTAMSQRVGSALAEPNGQQ